MMRTLILTVILMLDSFSVGQIHAETARRSAMPVAHRALLETHCFDCHDASSKEGSIDLENLSLTISRDLATAETWQKVMNAINSGEMPPEDSAPLPNDAKSSFLKDLSEQMVVARRILSDAGGVITLRRLNRREYANTLEALLGVRPDVSDLPNDQATSGFDTQGASLFMSSDQVEQYLGTARRTLELALLPRRKPSQRTIRIEPEEEYIALYTAALESMKDQERRAAAYFAQDEKPAKEFGFLDDWQAGRQRVAEWRPQFERYLARPETKHGITLLMTIKQGGYTKVKLPKLNGSSEGNYLIRVRAAAYPDATDRLSYLEFTSGIGSGRERLGWRKVTAGLEDPEIIEFPIRHYAGQSTQIWIHQRSHQDRADKNQATLDQKKNGFGTPPGLWIDWAELIGPLPREPQQSVLNAVWTDKPDKQMGDRETREVLETFAVAAFRGVEPSEDYLSQLEQHYSANRQKGEGVRESMLGPLSIILSSPSFLYMVEPTSDVDETLLDGPALAVRLSYLLWGGPPDEELMRLATNQELLEPLVLEQQTARMLEDGRAREFTRGFSYQWLQMDRLDMFQFDGVQFPTFDNAARESAREEVFETIEYIKEAKLPLQTLLKADFVVVNDILAGFYGIPGVEGHHFRRVDVPRESCRGGLLGTAAVLAMGSDGQRSSPVERGAWVLRKLLNNPPPPAPPNVPQLSRLDGKTLSARELARAHQEQPQCANCHQKIDPVGFGLENFDASGLWREQEVIRTGRKMYGKSASSEVFEIDASGQLAKGEEFADYFGLRDAVAKHHEDFVLGFAQSLITYGLGRPYGFNDQELAEEIALKAGQHDNQIDAFVHALVQSTAFRSR